jgi:hypothetical protein
MFAELEREMLNAGAEIILVRKSSQAAAAYGHLLLSLSGKPAAVGVDCEGTNAPQAMMIQTSSPSVVVVEVPASGGARYSEQLRSLMRDDGVTKVFCGAGGDTDCMPFAIKCTADIQRMARQKGDDCNQLGLGAVLSRADPQGREWSKQSFKQRGWWRLGSGQRMVAEQGFVQYAAADAWGTLQVSTKASGAPYRQRRKGAYTHSACLGTYTRCPVLAPCRRGAGLARPRRQRSPLVVRSAEW